MPVLYIPAPIPMPTAAATSVPDVTFTITSRQYSAAYLRDRPYWASNRLVSVDVGTAVQPKMQYRDQDGLWYWFITPDSASGYVNEVLWTCQNVPSDLPYDSNPLPELPPPPTSVPTAEPTQTPQPAPQPRDGVSSNAPQYVSNDSTIPTPIPVSMPVPSVSFSVSHTMIRQGECVNLTWRVDSPVNSVVLLDSSVHSVSSVGMTGTIQHPKTP